MRTRSRRRSRACRRSSPRRRPRSPSTRRRSRSPPRSPPPRSPADSGGAEVTALRAQVEELRQLLARQALPSPPGVPPPSPPSAGAPVLPTAGGDEPSDVVALRVSLAEATAHGARLQAENVRLQARLAQSPGGGAPRAASPAASRAGLRLGGPPRPSSPRPHATPGSPRTAATTTPASGARATPRTSATPSRPPPVLTPDCATTSCHSTSGEMVASFERGLRGGSTPGGVNPALQRARAARSVGKRGGGAATTATPVARRPAASPLNVPVASPPEMNVSAESAVYALVVGVGGVVCCAGRDQDIRLLDPDNGQCINRMVGHTDRVWALARCDADTLASGGNDKCVRLWRPEEAAPLSTLKGHRGPVHALATHRGLLMSGSADQSVKLWDLAEGGCVGTLWHSSERFRDRYAVHSLAVTAGDVLASGCWGGAVRLWDLHRCRCTRDFDAHHGVVWSLLHSEGRLCSAGSDGLIKLWDSREGSCTATLGATAIGALYCLAERDGLLFSGGYDQLVRVWDYRMMRCINELSGHAGAVRTLAFHDSRLLSGSIDGTVRLWDNVLGSATAQDASTGELHI
eukprot:Transcript_30242.p1 GENE.Transcript_30242~~Transcript_30242.p1  ORF type:complete len:576 (+),score=162.42 Transcript_30242:450-2177(+)